MIIKFQIYFHSCLRHGLREKLVKYNRSEYNAWKIGIEYFGKEISKYTSILMQIINHQGAKAMFINVTNLSGINSKNILHGND